MIRHAMIRQANTLLLALVLTTLIPVPFSCAQTFELAKEGKSADQLAAIDKRCWPQNKDHEDRVKAIDELVEFLKDESKPKLAASALYYLMRTRLARYNDYDDQYIALKIREVKNVALKHCDTLFKSNDKIHHRLASEAMACIGDQLPEESIQLLGTFLESKKTYEQWDALYCIKFIGPKAIVLEEKILPLLSTKDIQLQYAAVRAAGALGPKSKKGFDQLLKLCSDDTLITARTLAFVAAASTANGIPEREKLLIDLLDENLESRYYMVKQRSLEALAGLDKPTGIDLGLLKKWMTKDRSGLAPFASICYGKATGNYSASVDALVLRLKDPTDSGQCLIFLEKLAPHASTALKPVYDHAVVEPDQISDLHIKALDSISHHIKKDKILKSKYSEELKKVDQLFKQFSEANVDIVSHQCRQILKNRKEKN